MTRQTTRVVVVVVETITERNDTGRPSSPAITVSGANADEFPESYSSIPTVRPGLARARQVVQLRRVAGQR